MVDLALAARLREVIGNCSDDPAARVRGHELRDHLAQLGALLARFDLPRDPHFGREGHVHEESAGEGDLRRDARSLGANGFFDDLDELGLTALQLVGDVGRLTPAGAIAAAAIGNGLRGTATVTTVFSISPTVTVFVSVVGLAVGGILFVF